MHVSAAEYAVAFAAVLVGALVQGTVGFGLNLLAAPVVALVVPEALPVTLVLVSMPVSATTVAREHHQLDRWALRWLLVGALPGTVVGLLVVHAADPAELAVVIGAVTLLGVVLSVVSPPLAVTRRSAGLAGFAGNVTGTAAAVGGPPVALLFQHHPGPTVRSTLGAFFVTSSALSITGYLVTGEVDHGRVLFAVALLPAMAVGLWTSRHAHRVVDAGWLRPGVLTLSAIAGCLAIARGLA